jgi:cytoskeletal protein CcmA (bactofilin family)
MISRMINYFKRKKFEPNRFDSMISKSTTVNGNLLFDGHLVIDGTVNGSVSSQGTKTSAVTINGTVTGSSIHADFVVVSGATGAKIVATEQLVIKKNGLVNANCTYGSIIIEEGAVINGTLTKYCFVAPEIEDEIDTQIKD